LGTLRRGRGGFGLHRRRVPRGRATLVVARGLRLVEGVRTPVDCGKLALCGSTRRGPYCVCSATGCDIPPIETPEQYSIWLDGALEARGMELVGTLAVVGERFSVRLTHE
jgi:hypothetical protein